MGSLPSHAQLQEFYSKIEAQFEANDDAMDTVIAALKPQFAKLEEVCAKQAKTIMNNSQEMKRSAYLKPSRRMTKNASKKSMYDFLKPSTT